MKTMNIITKESCERFVVPFLSRVLEHNAHHPSPQLLFTTLIPVLDSKTLSTPRLSKTQPRRPSSSYLPSRHGKVPVQTVGKRRRNHFRDSSKEATRDTSKDGSGDAGEIRSFMNYWIHQPSLRSTMQPLVVKFYAPWCGHCRHFKKTWEGVGASFSSTPVTVGAVSCDVYNEVCSKQGVHGYPTVRAYNVIGEDGTYTSKELKRGEVGFMVEEVSKAYRMDPPAAVKWDG